MIDLPQWSRLPRVGTTYAYIVIFLVVDRYKRQNDTDKEEIKSIKNIGYYIGIL